MEHSIFIARIIGLLYLAVGLGMLINRDYYQKMIKGFTHEAPLTYFGGVMALLAGFLLVTYHNVWEGTWVVLITVIGWLALVKGLALLIFPELVMKSAKIWLSKTWWPVGTVFVLVLGLVLGYFGYLA